MDDRRRTISSEEQMIGEALMRVSNTLEAQRLTKSLDYQEKLRSRSNIRLIIAIICLFVAMMMMVISGSILFLLWRYADPVLDAVMPVLKGALGDFGVIWDGLLETLSYVPVMVEQLTRLLEQVIIMLEGINKIDLAGLMGYVSKMLGGVMTMMDDLSAALKPMMASLQSMLSTLAEEGLGEFLNELLGPEAAESIQKLLDGTWALLGTTGESLLTFSQNFELDPNEVTTLSNGVNDLLGSTGEALEKVSDGMSGIKTEDVQAVVDAGGEALQGMARLLKTIGSINITLPSWMTGGTT